MRTFIGWSLLALVVPYGLYACFHPEHAVGILALAVAGGIMIRRGRDERLKRIAAVVDDGADPVADAEMRLPPESRVPKFDPVEVDASELAEEPASASPAPAEMPAFVPRDGRRDEIPPPPMAKTGTVLKLVHSDGKRADVRDFRRRIAK